MAKSPKSQTAKKLQKLLVQHRDRIGRSRDDLRVVLDDFNSLAATCDAAIQCLDEAIDHLSEQA